MKQKRKPVPMFSLEEAAARGVDRVYHPNWACPLDHVKIDLFPDGMHGPWVHLYSPFNKHCNGRDPVSMLWGIGMDVHAKCFYAYAGPLPDSEEYKAEIAAYERVNVPDEIERLRNDFKNFHRLLCERFGYGHDEKDWHRDQLSLIEWIAQKHSPEPLAGPGVTIALCVSCCDRISRAMWALKPNAEVG